MRNFKTFLSLFFLLCCLSSFTRPSSFVIKGEVVDGNGKGIAGVVVNNGIEFAQTDAHGRFQLITDTLFSKFVSLSTPANYELPQTQGSADRFYKPVSECVNQKLVSFKLTRRTAPVSAFHYIAISDPQVKTLEQFNRWQNETCADLSRSADSLSATAPVIGMTLGDLVWDNMSLYPAYKKSLQNMKMTVFQCIGNHDFDKSFQDLHNSAIGAPSYAEQEYGRYFGPVNYSFNMGKVHVITIKAINYVGQRNYIESVTGQTLSWLKHDLSYVPKGTLVFLNMHPSAWNAIEDGNVRDARQMQALLSDYDVHVFCGHTHYYENSEVTPKLYQHNIGAACGAWWVGQVNRCGAPNGYLIVDVNGTSVKWHYKATGHPVSYQLRAYDKGAWLSQPEYVVANVWDYDSHCKVEWYQDGKYMGPMERFTDRAQSYLPYEKKASDAPLTSHLFRAKPQGDYQTATVVFTNRFGEKYSLTATSTRVIAHRGYWQCQGSAQNSIASLYNAQRMGCYGSEFDVWITRDGQTVIHHDPTVDGIRIEDADYAQIEHSKLPNGETLPTLADYLKQGKFDRGTNLILEIKPHTRPADEKRCVDAVLKQVEASGIANRVEFISFSKYACQLLAASGKNLKVAYLNGDLTPQQVNDSHFTGIDYQDMVLLEHPEWVKQAHQLGLIVNVWTVNKPADIDKFVKMKVDFITTNNPVYALSVTR